MSPLKWHDNRVYSGLAARPRFFTEYATESPWLGLWAFCLCPEYYDGAAIESTVAHIGIGGCGPYRAPKWHTGSYGLCDKNRINGLAQDLVRRARLRPPTRGGLHRWIRGDPHERTWVCFSLRPHILLRKCHASSFPRRTRDDRVVYIFVGRGAPMQSGHVRFHDRLHGGSKLGRNDSR